MKRVIILALLAILGGLSFAPIASATEAECWGNSYSWEAHYDVKPRSCDFNGGEAHAYQTNLRKIHWLSWNDEKACGIGTYVYNMGYRHRMRFCLYEPEDGIFTWIRGRWSAHYSYIDEHGKRVYKKGKASKFDRYLFPTYEDN